MGAYPYPLYGIADQLAHGAVMISDANGKSMAAAAFQFLKLERRVIVIALPKLIALARQFLHMSRQRVVQLPETPGAF